MVEGGGETQLFESALNADIGSLSHGRAHGPGANMTPSAFGSLTRHATLPMEEALTSPSGPNNYIITGTLPVALPQTSQHISVPQAEHWLNIAVLILFQRAPPEQSLF